MAVSYAQFIERFPELASAPQAVIETELAAAARRVNAAWGEQANDGIALLAAHAVALGPGGEFARLSKTGEKSALTTYGQRYQEMMRGIISGDRVP